MYRLFIEAVWLVAGVYLLGLWCHAVRRTRLRFFWLLVVSNVAAVIIDLIGVVRMLSDEAGAFASLHSIGFDDFFYSVKPVFFMLNLIAYTLMVRWIIEKRTRAVT